MPKISKTIWTYANYKSNLENKVNIVTEANESAEGPAFFTIEDPDGNPILLDQQR